MKRSWRARVGGVAVALEAESVLVAMTPWTVAQKAPLSMGFSRQEHWIGLPFPSPGDLPSPCIEPVPQVAGRFFITEPPGKSLEAESVLQSKFL